MRYRIIKWIDVDKEMPKVIGEYLVQNSSGWVGVDKAWEDSFDYGIQGKIIFRYAYIKYWAHLPKGVKI